MKRIIFLGETKYPELQKDTHPTEHQVKKNEEAK